MTRTKAMAPSIETLEGYLEQGRISLSELLTLRKELHRPFTLHPLGFLACTLLIEGSRKVRLHLWPVEGGAPQSSECQIHDHIFQFRSWVMAGAVENIEYAVSAKGQEFAVYRTEYIGTRSTLIKNDETLKLSELRRHTFSIGSSYTVPAGVLHKTERVGTNPAFTVLVTTALSTNAPLVLGPKTGLDRYVYERETLDDTFVEAILAGL